MQHLQRPMAVSPLLGPLGVAAGAGVVCCAIWLSNPTVPGGPIPVCPTKALLGIDCPGCGSMRMLYSLMPGDFSAALHFNAVGLIALVLLVWSYGAWTYCRGAGRRITSWQHRGWAAPAVLTVMCIWFVIRNVPIAPFISLYV